MLLLNFLAVGVIPYLLWRMYRSNPYSVLPIIFPVIMLIWQGLSVAYLETGVYSPELLQITQYTAGTLRFVAAIGIFLAAYWFVFERIVSGRMARLKTNNIVIRLTNERFNIVVVLVAGIAGIVLLNGAPSGIVLSRSLYLVENPSFARDLIFKYLPVITFLLGLAAGATRKQTTRSTCFAVLFFHLYILFLYGNKFSGLYGVVSFFVISFVSVTLLIPMQRPVFWVSLRVLVLVALALFCGLITIGISKYIAIDDLVAKEYLFDRLLILQGGIWWHTDYLANYGTDHPGMEGFLSFMTSVDFHPNTSLMYLMTRAIGHDLTYKIFFLHGSLFTGAFPAIFYEFFGLPSLILFSALSGMGIALISGYMVRKLLKGQLLSLVVAFSLYLPIIIVLDAGEFLQLFSVNFAVKVYALLFVESIYVVNKQICLSTQKNREIVLPCSC